MFNYLTPTTYIIFVFILTVHMESIKIAISLILHCFLTSPNMLQILVRLMLQLFIGIPIKSMFLFPQQNTIIKHTLSNLFILCLIV